MYCYCRYKLIVKSWCVSTKKPEYLPGKMFSNKESEIYFLLGHGQWYPWGFSEPAVPITCESNENMSFEWKVANIEMR